MTMEFFAMIKDLKDLLAPETEAEDHIASLRTEDKRTAYYALLLHACLSKQRDNNVKLLIKETIGWK